MDRTASGWISGFIGMVIFSVSLPATRAAVMDFDPVFLSLARAAIAGLLGLGALLIFREKRPRSDDLLSLAIVALGVVVGFPLLTALALQHVSAAHSLVFIGLLPLCTASFGVLRGGERPRPAFWLFSALGAALVIGYALTQGGSATLHGDIFMLCAIVACGLGYAEGGRLSRKLGGWQVICWGLVLALPLVLPLTFLEMPASFGQVSAPAWWGLAYVSLFSMLIGFVFWYRGLALAGIATVGQLQLLQPFFGLFFAALLLKETVGWSILLVALGVAACVGAAKKFAA